MYRRDMTDRLIAKGRHFPRSVARPSDPVFPPISDLGTTVAVSYLGWSNGTRAGYTPRARRVTRLSAVNVIGRLGGLR